MEWTVSADVVAEEVAASGPLDEIAVETIIALEADPQVLAPATRADHDARTVGATFCVVADSLGQAVALGLERLAAAVRVAGVTCAHPVYVEVLACGHDQGHAG